LGELDHLSKAWAAAARLNGRVGNRSLVEELEDRIRQGDQRSIELAGRLGPVVRQGNLIPALLVALEDQDEDVRSLIGTLLALLHDERWAAATAGRGGGCAP
jgi:hypothetical protein